MEIPSQHQWARKTLFLIRLLIFSGALNIGLLSSCFYYIIQKKETPGETVKQKKVVRDSSADRLSEFTTMPYKNLIKLLNNQEIAGEGYKVRDLALASLTTFHFFNIEKALQGFLLPKRTIFFQRKGGPEQIAITLYPGLGEDHFQAIDYFIKTEKFPFTPKGLFFELQQQKMPRDDDLVEAFYLTQEFSTIMTLFNRGGVPIPKEYVVDLLTAGDWDFIENFAIKERYGGDCFEDRLKFFLTHFIRCRSLLGAKILLRLDWQFIVKNFSDSDLVFFLDLFCSNSCFLDTLLKNLIVSPRSDVIWKKAAEKLYNFSHLEMPDPYDHHLTVQMFAPSETVSIPKEEKKLVLPSPKTIQKIHVVQPGDSLWKIGVQYKISVEKLQKINHLKTDRLKIGTSLIVTED